MNLFFITVFISLFGIGMIAAARKLASIGSFFSQLIYRFGIYFAIIALIILVFADSAEDISLQLGDSEVLLYAIVSAIVLYIFEGELGVCRNDFLKPPVDKKGKIIKKAFSGKRAAAVTFIDLLEMLLGGFAVGVCFAMNINAGVVAVVTFALLDILHKSDIEELYQNTIIDPDRIQKILNLSYIPYIIASPIAMLVARTDDRLGAILEAIAFGYFLSFILRQTLSLVKKRLNR